MTGNYKKGSQVWHYILLTSLWVWLDSRKSDWIGKSPLIFISKLNILLESLSKLPLVGEKWQTPQYVRHGEIFRLKSERLRKLHEGREVGQGVGQHPGHCLDEAQKEPKSWNVNWNPSSRELFYMAAPPLSRLSWWVWDGLSPFYLTF